MKWAMKLVYFNLNFLNLVSGCFSFCFFSPRVPSQFRSQLKQQEDQFIHPLPLYSPFLDPPIFLNSRKGFEGKSSNSNSCRIQLIFQKVKQKLFLFTF